MTPDEVYDKFYCYNVLQKFPEHILNEAIDKLTFEGTLIKNRGARSIPGMKRSLAAKFLKLMTGELPFEMLKQAKEYEKFLGTQDTRIRCDPTYVSSGMIACMLNLLSSHKVSFCMNTFLYIVVTRLTSFLSHLLI